MEYQSITNYVGQFAEDTCTREEAVTHEDPRDPEPGYEPRTGRDIAQETVTYEEWDRQQEAFEHARDQYHDSCTGLFHHMDLTSTPGPFLDEARNAYKTYQHEQKTLRAMFDLLPHPRV